MTKVQPAFYDPAKTYEQNFKDGPSLLSQHLQPQLRNSKPTYKFLNFDVNTPFGIPAGPLLNSRYVHEAFRFGFDVNVYKTQRTVPFSPNDFPNVLYLDIDGDLTLEKAKEPIVGKKQPPTNTHKFSITNSFGNPSRGPEFWQEDLKKALTYQGEGQLLIMSVVGTIQSGFSEEDYHDDFAKAAGLANETGVKVIEVNLSCPNVANEGVICFNPEADQSICKKVKEKIGDTPLLIKLGYFSHEQEPLLEKVLEKTWPYIAGISAINTIPAPVVDEQGNQALPGPNRLKSGICGDGIRWAGVDMVQRLAKLRDKLDLDFAIIGVGGVMDVVDYEEYRNVGADLVQSATGAMWNPNLGYQVWEKDRI